MPLSNNWAKFNKTPRGIGVDREEWINLRTKLDNARKSTSFSSESTSSTANYVTASSGNNPSVSEENSLRDVSDIPEDIPEIRIEDASSTTANYVTANSNNSPDVNEGNSLRDVSDIPEDIPEIHIEGTSSIYNSIFSHSTSRISADSGGSLGKTNFGRVSEQLATATENSFLNIENGNFNERSIRESFHNVLKSAGVTSNNAEQFVNRFINDVRDSIIQTHDIVINPNNNIETRIESLKNLFNTVAMSSKNISDEIGNKVLSESLSEQFEKYSKNILEQFVNNQNVLEGDTTTDSGKSSNLISSSTSANYVTANSNNNPDVNEGNSLRDVSDIPEDIPEIRIEDASSTTANYVTANSGNNPSVSEENSLRDVSDIPEIRIEDAAFTSHDDATTSPNVPNSRTENFSTTNEPIALEISSVISGISSAVEGAGSTLGATTAMGSSFLVIAGVIGINGLIIENSNYDTNTEADSDSNTNNFNIAKNNTFLNSLLKPKTKSLNLKEMLNERYRLCRIPASYFMDYKNEPTNTLNHRLFFLDYIIHDFLIIIDSSYNNLKSELLPIKFKDDVKERIQSTKQELKKYNDISLDLLSHSNYTNEPFNIKRYFVSVTENLNSNLNKLDLLLQNNENITWKSIIEHLNIFAKESLNIVPNLIETLNQKYFKKPFLPCKIETMPLRSKRDIPLINSSNRIIPDNSNEMYSTLMMDTSFSNLLSAISIPDPIKCVEEHPIFTLMTCPALFLVYGAKKLFLTNEAEKEEQTLNEEFEEDLVNSSAGFSDKNIDRGEETYYNTGQNSGSSSESDYLDLVEEQRKKEENQGQSTTFNLPSTSRGVDQQSLETHHQGSNSLSEDLV